MPPNKIHSKLIPTLHHHKYTAWINLNVRCDNGQSLVPNNPILSNNNDNEKGDGRGILQVVQPYTINGFKQLNKVHEAGRTIIPSSSYSRWYRLMKDLQSPQFSSSKFQQITKIGKIKRSTTKKSVYPNQNILLSKKSNQPNLYISKPKPHLQNCFQPPSAPKLQHPRNRNRHRIIE